MPSQLMNSQEIAEALENLATQISQRHPDASKLILIGIQRRGHDLALRLYRNLQKMGLTPAKLGSLDINLYRDDWTSIAGKPQIGQSDVPLDLQGRVIILVDDVLFSGRTIRAALEALLDYDRPKAVELLVLVDRGNRELPIQADYIGRKIQTSRSQHIDVLCKERDGQDAVLLIEN